MSKLSILDIVQDILSDMNDDEVNSISDTIESMQVAQIVKSTYFELIGNKNWPHLHRMGTLKQVGDLEKPTHMRVHDSIKELKNVEYDCRSETKQSVPDYKKVDWVEPDDFLRRSNTINNELDNTRVITDFSGIKFSIKDDTNPSCYTSFDDEHVVFDSYNKNIEDTIQESRNRIWAVFSPTFTLKDEFIPDLPEEAFPALLAEAKSTCFSRIKQAPDGKAEQQSRRQRNWLSRKAFQVEGGIKLPNYARTPRK